MRQPDYNIDGWCLDDGEERHQEAPSTFWIPDHERRSTLLPGDLAKLIFRFALDGEEDVTERMWVIVRERIENGYLGVLDNKPSSIAENNEFWLGAELPFEARHVIAVEVGCNETRKMAAQPPSIPWRRT
jgi:hypothetical protein